MVFSRAEIKQITHWVEMGTNKDGTHNICCGFCGKGKLKSKGHANSYYTLNKYKYCIECGCWMVKENIAMQIIARNAVQK